MDEFQNGTGTRVPVEIAVKTAIDWLDPPADGEAPEMPEPDPGQIAAQNDQSFQALMGLLGNTQIAGQLIG